MIPHGLEETSSPKGDEIQHGDNNPMKYDNVSINVHNYLNKNTDQRIHILLQLFTSP